MWWIIGAIVIAVIIILIRCANRDVQSGYRPSDSRPSGTSEPDREENSGPDEDYDECRCSSPGGACCWK